MFVCVSPLLECQSGSRCLLVDHLFEQCVVLRGTQRPGRGIAPDYAWRAVTVLLLLDACVFCNDQASHTPKLC